MGRRTWCCRPEERVIAFVLLIYALNGGATGLTADEAAMAVAEGGQNQLEALEVLTRRGRFGLRALTQLSRKTTGAPLRRVYEAIGAFKGAEAFSALLEGIRTTDPQAQLGAVRGLGRIGSKEAIEPLVQTAFSPDAEVRAAIVEALARIGIAAAPAVEQLQKSGSPYARETALRVLTRLYSGPRRRELIINGLRDADTSVRSVAVDLTELWRDVSLAEALVELAKDKDAEVASRAVEAIAKFPAMRKTLPEVLGDSRVTRQAWLTAFHRLRDYDDMAIPYLMAAITKAEPRRQSAMLDLLTEDSSEGELRGFVRMLDTPDVDVGTVVQGLLAQMGARADTAAARMVLDERESLVDAIKSYLSTRPRNGITEEIIQAAKEGPLEQRQRHIQIMGELNASEVRQDLVDLLVDTTAEVRATTAKVLGDIGDLGAEAELVRLLDDVNTEVRIEALRGLKGIQSSMSVLARTSAIEDPDPEVSSAAKETFEGSDADYVLDVLERVVRTGSHEERVSALTAIAEVKTTRAAVLLVELVTEGDEKIKKAATDYFDTLPKLDPIYEHAGLGMDKF